LKVESGVITVPDARSSKRSVITDLGIQIHHSDFTNTPYSTISFWINDGAFHIM